MKKIGKILTSRIFIFVVAACSEVFWLYLSLNLLMGISPWLNIAFQILAVLLALWTLNRRINPSYQIAWVILILAVPVFGIVLYFLYGNSRRRKNLRRNLDCADLRKTKAIVQDQAVSDLLSGQDGDMGKESLYIRSVTGFPVYSGGGSKYYALGEAVLPDMLEDLKNARKFIFMEYFIIGEGFFWKEIQKILILKAAAGVEVRVMYDDFGSASVLPYHYYKFLRAQGIQCICFNEFHLPMSLIINNRDHRKILDIDGETAYTGGFNIADEYINRKVRFGQWKDAGVRITGAAVNGFTAMFLQMWSAVKGNPPEFSAYLTHPHLPSAENRGFIQPYADIPFDDELVGENVYAGMIAHARKYVYIYTPYLVLDSYMTRTLCLAANAGIDVRIVTPGIPDKKIVYFSTRSNYSELLDAGIRIYEYTPGFLHSKCMLSDDTKAVIGSINLDYRSLNLNFEDAVLLYRTDAVKELRDDFQETFAKCREITAGNFVRRNVFIGFIQAIVKIFAPLF